MAVADPAGSEVAARVAGLSERVAAATQRVVATAAGLSDQQVRDASLLPGWSRGHVLTHLARNADSMRNLLIWARTGVETPQYRSAAARDQDIQAGAGRPTAELRADLEASATALTAQAATLAAADWRAEVRGLFGDPHPAWYTLWRRLREVEIHHVDLDAGYGPADWPWPFATDCLAGVAGDFTDPGDPAVVLRCLDSGSEYRIGPPGQEPHLTVSGPTPLLLAWLIGRDSGAGLTVEPAGPLPPVPPW